MKIEAGEHGELVLTEVYNGVGIRTQGAGDFGICERDGGIEVTRDGELIFCCYTKINDGLELPPPHFRQCDSMCHGLRCTAAAGHGGEHQCRVSANQLAGQWSDPQ
jgi:hypothetical protein